MVGIVPIIFHGLNPHNYPMRYLFDPVSNVKKLNLNKAEWFAEGLYNYGVIPAGCSPKIFSPFILKNGTLILFGVAMCSAKNTQPPN